MEEDTLKIDLLNIMNRHLYVDKHNLIVGKETAIAHIIEFYNKEKEKKEKEYKEITGFSNGRELEVYEKGRSDEETVIVKWIEKWDGSKHSAMGDLLSKKLKEQHILQEENIKKSLEKIDAHCEALIKANTHDEEWSRPFTTGVNAVHGFVIFLKNKLCQ